MSLGKWQKASKSIFRGRRTTLKKVISLHKRRVSWKWRVCIAVTLGFAVSESGFRGVEPCCYIGICDAECLPRSSLLWEVSWNMFVLEAWILALGESFAGKCSFWKLGYFHFWWKSRGKCSLWKLGFSLLVKVSLENGRFGRLHLTFSESLVVSSKGASVLSRVPSKNVQQECPFKSVPQGCQTRMSSKSACPQECPARVSSKSVKQECQERVSSKEC